MKIASIFAIALLLSASMPCGAMQLPIENSEIEKEIGEKIVAGSVAWADVVSLRRAIYFQLQ
jgi:hypothetical protein